MSRPLLWQDRIANWPAFGQYRAPLKQVPTPKLAGADVVEKDGE